MDVALTRVFKFNTRQCARQHPEYLLVSSLITYANSLCLWIKLFATMCWRHLESTYNQMFPRTFFWRGGGLDIERNQWPGSSDIDGQHQCEHMLNLVTVIAIFWVHRETMFKASTIRRRKIIKIQNNEFSDRPCKCTFCSRTLHMANDDAESNL